MIVYHTGSFVDWPFLVTRCVQDNQRKDIDIPHSVDSGEESRGELQVDVLVPLPATFRYLADDETNHGQGRTQQGCQHEKLEAVDDALVVQPAGGGHRREGCPLEINVAKHSPNHVAQEQEVQSR